MNQPVADSSQYISVVAQLMQNYREGKPVRGDCQIVCVANPQTNKSELVSIGSDGQVYHIYPDATSETGWSLVDLNYTSSAKFVTAYEASGSLTILASDGPTLSLLQPAFSAQWQAVALPQGINAVGGLKATTQGDQAFAVLQDAATIANFIFTLTSGVAGWNPLVPQVPYTPVDFCPAFIEVFQPAAGVFPGVFDAHVLQGSNQAVAFVYSAGNPGFSFPNIEYAALSVAYDEQNHAVPFALSSTDMGIYYLYGASSSSPAYQAQKVSADVAINVFAASSSGAGVLEVFGLSTDRKLYHARQSHRTGAWGPFLALEHDLRFVQLAASRNGLGFTEVFAITAKNELYHIWQEPGTEEWTFERVLVTPATQSKREARLVREYESYNLQVTVVDTEQAMAPGAAVKVLCDDPVAIDINNEVVFLDVNNPWSGIANAAGQITLSIATDSLATVPLKIWTSFMPEGDAVTLDPSGSVLSTLAGLDDAGAHLKAARVTQADGTTTPLIAGKYADDSGLMGHVSKAIQSTMALAIEQPTPTATLSRRWRAPNDPLVARYLPAGSSRPYAGPAKPLHFEVDLSGERPVTFRPLTAEQAAALFETYQADSLSLLGIDLASAWNAVKRKVAKVTKFAFETVSNGIKCGVRFVIDGAEYVWNGVIEFGARFVRQAFDLVEEVFSRIGVFFENLFGWLGRIFNWGAIKRTHRVIAYSIDQMLKLIEDGAQVIQAAIDNNIENFETWVSDQFATSIASFDGRDDDLFQYQNANNKPNTEATNLASANPVLSAFINNSAKADDGATMPPELSLEVSQKLKDLLEEVKKYGDSIHSAESFKKAGEYFQKAATSPDAVGQMLISALLELAEGMVLTVIGGVRIVIDMVCDAISAIVHALQSLMSAEWDIPFVSALYRHVTDGPMTAVNIVSLILAVPATALYTLGKKAPPFADEAAVKTFQQNFTAANILGALGAKQRAGVAADVPALSDTWTDFFGYLSCANLLVNAATSTIVDSEPPIPLPNWFPTPGKLITWAAFIVEAALLVSYVPSLINLAYGFNCTPQGAPNWLWGVQLVGTVVDGICVAAAGKFPQVVANAGVAWASGFGFVDLAFTFVVAIVAKPSGSAIAANFCTTVPEFCKLLRQKDLVKDSKGASLLGLMMLDAVFYTASSFLTLFPLMASEEAQAASTA